MPDPDYQPPTTLADALDEALERLASERTIENATRIIARGNTMRITMTFDQQESGSYRIVTQCEERLKTWTIHVAKNLDA